MQYDAPCFFQRILLRIAVVNANRSRVGGAETYLSTLLPALSSHGHEVAFCSENEQSPGSDSISIPQHSEIFHLSDKRKTEVISDLRDWAPEILYVHGLANWQLEESILDIAPAVFYAHDYYGTCISGDKTHKLPMITPCDRSFGPACLLQFYPRRCGGLSPFTMWQRYQVQSERLRLLHRYRALLTNSQHMVAEFQKHGIRAECVYLFPQGENGTRERIPTDNDEERAWRILFLGRMYKLKGGRYLLDAVANVKNRLKRDIHVTFAGSGVERESWQGQAQQVQAKHPGITVEFVGWVDKQRRQQLLQNSDLLVVPSLWPEPFGMGGIEAGMHSVPSVGFAVGGIPEWLKEGVNGCLAAGDPPTVESLSEAIVRSLQNPEFYRRLRQGAKAQALTFSRERHILRLMEIFEQIR